MIAFNAEKMKPNASLNVNGQELNWFELSDGNAYIETNVTYHGRLWIAG